MKQLSLPLHFDVNVGDRVVILDKSIGDRLGSGYFGSMFRKGDEEFVQGVGEIDDSWEAKAYGVEWKGKPIKYCTIRGGMFLMSDVRRIK